MTDADWKAWPTDEDTGRLEEYLEGRGSPRKLRLFACACCRRIADRLTDPRSKRAVELAEQYADGAAGPEALSAAWQDANQALSEMDRTTDENDEYSPPYNAALAAHWSAIPASREAEIASLAGHAAFYAL